MSKIVLFRLFILQIYDLYTLHITINKQNLTLFQKVYNFTKELNIQ